MRIRLAAAAAALVAALNVWGCTPAPAPSAAGAPNAVVIAEESAKLKTFLNGEFEKDLAMSPERLTRLGRKDQYNRLDDYSEAQAQREFDFLKSSVADMKAKFDPAKLDAEAQTSYDMWSFGLERALVRQKYKRHAYVFGYQGPQSELPNFLINNHRVDAVADMEAYNARLAAIGPAIDQLLERAKAAATDGVRMPKFHYLQVIKESQALTSGQPFVAKGPDNALWADAKAKIAGLVKSGKATPDQAKALQAGSRTALIEKMKPSYERLIAWAKEDQVKAPTGKVGALTLPDGAGWYDASIFLLTTTHMSADEIHKLGLSEVKRIQGEIDQIRTKVGFKGDLKAFFKYTSTDPKFFLPNTDDGRTRFIAMADGYLTAMKAKLPDYFGRLPKAPLVVRRVEAFREVPGGAAHYSRPTPDGAKPGIFYMHLSDMKAEPVWDLESVAYHEGVPGHHMQIAIQNELTDLPLFRTQASNSAYTEGWGLYAEGLAKEMGFYTDPYSDYGRLSGELWRAVRLVVDSGLHSQGWTEEDAVKYALDNTPKPEAGVRAEVHRFILWPAQATSYKIGALTILRLREEAKTALGPKFDIKAFHDTVIGGGALPLPVLETRVHRWIDAQKGGAPASQP